MITAEVPEIYMHQFLNTIKKIKDTDAYQFKLDKQKFQIDIEVFHEILQICLRLLNQDFVEPPSDEEMVPFIKELGYTGKCISGKSTCLDRLMSLRAQRGMFYKKNVYFVALLWENFIFQAYNREISSAHYQKYGALIPEWMINQAIQDSKEYNIYLAVATGEGYFGNFKLVEIFRFYKDQKFQEERALIASLTEQMKLEINESKKINKTLESSNKVLQKVNMSLGNELEKYRNMTCVKDVEFECAKAYALLEEQRIKSKKPFDAYTLKIHDLNQKLSKLEKQASAHQTTISTLSSNKEELK
ncbi:hypothetical protein Tco_0635472 [Tanacetum coccineum]